MSDTSSEDADCKKPSKYTNMRRSFISKFGSIFSSFHSDTSPTSTAPAERRKTKPFDPMDPEDLDEIKQLVVDGSRADSRREALLGLFKVSLRENCCAALVEHGALEVIVKGMQEERVGSGARRAACQALRNLAACPANEEVMIETAAGPLAGVIQQEAPGSGVREAALDALGNLAQNAGNRSKLAAVSMVKEAIMKAATTELQGSPGREAAAILLERLSQIYSPPKVQEGNKMARQFSDRVMMRKSVTVAMTQQQPPSAAVVELEEAFEVDGLITACADTVMKEPKGSGARATAVRTLKNIACSGTTNATKISDQQKVLDCMLAAAKEESPGSELRATVFATFSELANIPDCRPELMKTKDLTETAFTAVRDEAPKSLAKEHAMFTIARLCIDPTNRVVFMKGAMAESLIAACLKACKQEAPGSGGRAAALEMCAALALAPENLAALFNAPGLLELAVESAFKEESERVKHAGLEVIASLASSTPANREHIFKMKHTRQAVVNAVNEKDPEMLEVELIKTSGFAALRSLCLNPEILSELKKSTANAVMNSARQGRPNSRMRLECLRMLNEGFFDQWNDSTQVEIVINVACDTIRDSYPGSEARTLAFKILHQGLMHPPKGEEYIAKSEALFLSVLLLRDFAEMVNKTKKHESYSRKSLRRQGQSKFAAGTSAQIQEDAKLAIYFLAACARKRIVNESAMSVITTVLKGFPWDKEKNAATTMEGSDLKVDEDFLALAVFCACLSIPQSCSTLEHANEFSVLLAQDMIPRVFNVFGAVTDDATMLKKSDAALALFTLSCYEECVEKSFDTPLVERLASMLIAASDSGENPMYQYSLCSTMLNCMFLPSLVAGFAISEVRSKMEAPLLRIVNRGADEFVFASAGRVAGALSAGLKLCGQPLKSWIAPPVSKTLAGRVSVLSSSDGLKMALAITTELKKKKAMQAQVEEAEWIGERVIWAKVQTKTLRVAFDIIMNQIKVCSAIFVSESPTLKCDAVLRLFVDSAARANVPIVFVKAEADAVAAEKATCYGSWVDNVKKTYPANVRSVDLKNVAEWKTPTQ